MYVSAQTDYKFVAFHLFRVYALLYYARRTHAHTYMYTHLYARVRCYDIKCATHKKTSGRARARRYDRLESNTILVGGREGPARVRPARPIRV